MLLWGFSCTCQSCGKLIWRCVGWSFLATFGKAVPWGRSPSYRQGWPFPGAPGMSVSLPVGCTSIKRRTVRGHTQPPATRERSSAVCSTPTFSFFCVVCGGTIFSFHVSSRVSAREPASPMGDVSFAVKLCTHGYMHASNYTPLH